MTKDELEAEAWRQSPKMKTHHLPQTQFTQAARRTLRKISTNRYSPRRFAFGLAWAKWAKDRPYGELLAALARVDAVLDLNPKAPTAELVDAMKNPQLPERVQEALDEYCKNLK